MYEKAILAFIEPITQHAIKECTNCHELQFDANSGRLTIKLTFLFPYQCFSNELEEALQTTLCEQFPEITSVHLQCDHQLPLSPLATEQSVAGVNHIIAVGSGKGGVGKSSTAVSLAMALRANGARVGLLDADIYGPSIPTMTGLSGKPDSPDGKTIIPMLANGVEVMSIGFLVNDADAMIWRGPMATSALQQMLRETAWGYHQGDHDLDYLIIDLPPGTGDIQLTMAQKIPVSGAVVVTTPQDIALIDVKRALKMFEKVDIPVLGVVENMSIHICQACGYAEAIFGDGGIEKLQSEFDVKPLAKLPLNATIRKTLDRGQSMVDETLPPELVRTYLSLAVRSAAELSAQCANNQRAVPTITIE